MKIIRGLARLDGHAKAGSDVEVIAAGEVIATTKTGADGHWAVESLDLPAGEHTIHAVAAGKASAAIEVEIEADDDEGETSSDRETIAERGERLYRKLVEARAQGFDIDPDLGNEVLAMAGKAMDDFSADVAELSYYLADEQFAEIYFSLDD